MTKATYSKKIIFAVDYDPVSNLIDNRGRILETLQSSNLFSDGGFSEFGVSAVQKSDRISTSFNVAWNKLGIDIESDSCNPESHHSVIKFAEKTLHDISVKKVKRIGARFLFLKPVESFEFVNSKIINEVDKGLLDCFGSPCFDSSLVFVLNRGSIKSKVAIGPLQKREYGQWFNKPIMINFDAGFLCDFDSYTMEYEYKTIHLEKFIMDAYDYAGSVADKLFSRFVI